MNNTMFIYEVPDGCVTVGYEVPYDGGVLPCFECNGEVLCEDLPRHSMEVSK